MVRLKLFWLTTAALALCATEGLAQQPPAPPTRPAAQGAPPQTAVEGVTVTAPPTSGLRTSIDRRSYSVTDDLQGRTGSIADALRNIPSVEVDVQGNVSLRGDPNVTIMIDGKPSGMFKGQGKADALQQLPADQIERVEVITVPSAAFKADGSGGIINLVTKKTRGAGASGSVRANYGSGGRYNAGVSGAYNSRTLTLSGDLGFRHDTQKTSLTDSRTRTDPSGATYDSLRFSAVRSGVDIVNGRGSVEYDLDARTRLTAEVRGSHVDVDSTVWEAFDTEAATGRTLRDRLMDMGYARTDAEISAGYRRKFDGEGHELTIDLSHEREGNDVRQAAVNHLRQPAGADVYERISSDYTTRETDLEIDYSRPLPGEAKLKLGYEFEQDELDADNFGARGPAPGSEAADAALTNRFLHEQRIHTLYGTYERPLGDLTVLAGLRVEHVGVEIDQRTSGVRADNDYTGAYPSLHLSYRLDDEQQLSFGYSRRVQRPRAEDMNPYRVYVDPFNLREGNPRLKPQETDSFEVAYQKRAGQTYYLATLYYRQSSNGVTDVVRDLGGGVFLNTRANLSKGRSGGLELVANGRLAPKLTYNFSSNIFWNEIDASRLGFKGTRSAFTVSGRANLNWQVTPDDLVQVNVFGNAKRLTAQGYREPFGMLNLGYRHKFDERVSMVVTVQDALNSVKDRQIYDTPILKGVAEREFPGRSVFVGLHYSFGGGRPRDPGFDFGGGGPT